MSAHFSDSSAVAAGPASVKERWRIHYPGYRLPTARASRLDSVQARGKIHESRKKKGTSTPIDFIRSSLRQLHNTYNDALLAFSPNQLQTPSALCAYGRVHPPGGIPTPAWPPKPSRYGDTALRHMDQRSSTRSRRNF